MNATEAARREAEKIHLAAVAAGSDPWKPLDLIRKEASRLGLDVYAVADGDSALRNAKAVFDRQANIILHQASGSDFDRAFLIAHELGHVILEGGAHDVVTTRVEQDRAVESAPIGIEKVMDYGARERREVRMDLFARELLLPRSMVRRFHVFEELSSVEIAKRLGAPLKVVQQQLLDALLLPTVDLSHEAIEVSSEPFTADPSQLAAATHRNSAFQLQAGPGTGKTRTLVCRIEGLLAEGVDPMSILVLTFSNKAANELSERLAQSNPIAAAVMWIGTFHAFGLDIVRRFHDRLGLPADPQLIDRSEAIELLEDELPRLPLRHYRNLWDPALDLSDMLNAISRAKDEVIDATGYRSLAQAMAAKAGDDADAAVRAEKSLEVALLFETYERLLASKQLLDFGDLIAHPVRLVEKDNEVVNALKSRHQHVLVDEYQDVNRASVRLLKKIVGDGQNLWVVGDARQSIYRFRGASATNMGRFTVDFPGAEVAQLGVNYRSSKEVVDIFTEFSRTMKASSGALPLQLNAVRGASNKATEFRVVGSTDDEISSVAATIKAQNAAGMSYRNQALLCVSNARLGEIAEGLEARGIPVLHLGSLFERPEIKDLMTLLSLLADPHAAGLLRVATIPGYEIALKDVVKIVSHLRESQPDKLSWCEDVTHIPELESESRHSLLKLATLFADLTVSDSPWSILMSWVIDGLGLAKALHLAADSKSRMKGLAVWQFLNFCRNQPSGSGSGTPSVRLLDRIRRLVLLSEDRGLRQLPSAVEGIDAVRLMTVHASKGLEFDVVHIPGLVTSSLPRNNTPPRCIPPDGLIQGCVDSTGVEAVKAGHEEEEECLFFVALSRSRDRLFLYASSVQSDGKTRNQSKFISPINRLLVRPVRPQQLEGSPRVESAIQINWAERPVWSDRQVNLFEKCPRRFLYSYVLKLGGRRTETPFMKMHNVVGDVFEWLQANHATTTPSEMELTERFNAAWQAKGATDHGYADDYQQIGRQLVDFLITSRSSGSRSVAMPISLSWVEGEIVVTPDSVAHDDTGRVFVRRVKTGKARSDVFDDLEYTILHLAAVQQYGVQAQVEVTFLTSETTETMSISARKLENRRHKINDMMQSVKAGDFKPKKDSRTCPRCPSFFICGDLPGGALTINKVGSPFRS